MTRTLEDFETTYLDVSGVRRHAGSDTAGDSCPLYARDCGSAVSGAKGKPDHTGSVGRSRSGTKDRSDIFPWPAREMCSDRTDGAVHGGARFIRDVRGDTSIEQRTGRERGAHANVPEQGGTAFF